VCCILDDWHAMCCAIVLMASMSQGCPAMCTGMMAFVRSLIAASSSSGFMLSVSGSTSTKRTWHPCSEWFAVKPTDGRHDHLVARPDPQLNQRQVQRRGAGNHADGVGCVDCVRKEPLKAPTCGPT